MQTWRNTLKGAKTVLPYLRTGNKIAVISIKTTGLGETANSDKSRILQFSGTMLDTDGAIHEISKINILINPEISIDHKTEQSTGLTNELLGMSENESKAITVIDKWLSEATVLAFYNTKYHIKYLGFMYERCNRSMPEYPTIDVLEMVKDTIPREESGDYKLQSVYDYLYPDSRAVFSNTSDNTVFIINIMLQCADRYLKHNTEQGKIQKKAEYAYYWVNPRNPRQIRLKVVFDKKNHKALENTYIFYDCFSHCWSCKSDKKAKELFNKIDLSNLEKQLLDKYAWLQTSDMDDLAKKLKQRQKERNRQSQL